MDAAIAGEMKIAIIRRRRASIHVVL